MNSISWENVGGTVRNLCILNRSLDLRNCQALINSQTCVPFNVMDFG
jgi:hypothetical protein